MPIRPELRDWYGDEWQSVIRPRIHERDQERCKLCGIPRGGRKLNRYGRWYRVQLGVAHLNHLPWDNRDENLALLCSACHITHDAAHHRESQQIRKDTARPLLAAVSQYLTYYLNCPRCGLLTLRSPERRAVACQRDDPSLCGPCILRHFEEVGRDVLAKLRAQEVRC